MFKGWNHTIRRKRFKMDTLTYSLGQLGPGGQSVPIKLDKLPVHNEFGVGIVLGVEHYMAATIGTTNGDPAIPWYMLQRLMDHKMRMGDQFYVVDRKGYHDPVREYLQQGRFVGSVFTDIAGGGTTTWSRTMTKRVSFVEPGSTPHKFWRAQPVTLWQMGQFEVTPYTTAQVVNGAHPLLTDVALTPYVEIADFPLNAVPIGVYLRERAKTGDNLNRPTPDPGQFWRVWAALDPATASFKDDLGTFTTIEYGIDGLLKPVPRNTQVTEHMRTWNDRRSKDAKLFWSGLTAGSTDASRFLDPTVNTTGRLHAIPLQDPEGNHGVREAPNWGATQKPELIINNDNRAGTPSPIDLLIDEVVDRSDEQLRLILESIVPGGWNKFVARGGYSKFSLYPQTGPGAVDPRRAPLVVDLS